MDTLFNSETNFNELIFENRNKEYGAYVIRKSYTDNMTISLFVALGFFGLLALSAALYSRNGYSENNEIPLIQDSLITIPYDLTPPAPEELQKQDKIEPQKLPKSTTDYVEPTDKPVDNPDPIPSDVFKGDPKGTDTPSILVDSSGFYAGTKKGGTTEPPTPLTFIADEMPDFIGGISQYVAKNLVIPRIAVEELKSGTVYLTFVVERDGSVSNVKILKDIGLGCGDEAVRVITGMPKWKPGKNQGKPVRVQFNLPIRFSIK
jgi:periplasmic protein TonB